MTYVADVVIFKNTLEQKMYIDIRILSFRFEFNAILWHSLWCVTLTIKFIQPAYKEL